MKTNCTICGGNKPLLTIAQTEEGKKVHVHTEMCLSVFNSRKRAKKKRNVDLKTAGIHMWSVEWEETRYGWVHKRPCPCPKHNDFDKKTEVKYTD